MKTLRHRIYIQDGAYFVKMDDPVDGWVWIEAENWHGGRCRKAFTSIWTAKEGILEVIEGYKRSNVLLIEEGLHEIA